MGKMYGKTALLRGTLVFLLLVGNGISGEKKTPFLEMKYCF
jgi:hypothetical protein